MPPLSIRRSVRSRLAAGLHRRDPATKTGRNRWPRPGACNTRQVEPYGRDQMSSKMMASRKASDLHANRLLGLLPPRITSGSARIFIEFRWSTGSLSIVLTSRSNCLFHRDWRRLPGEHHDERRRSRGRNDRQRGRGGSASCVGRRSGAYKRLRPGSRRRTENEGGAVQKGTGTKRFDADGDVRYGHAFFNQVAQSAACMIFIPCSNDAAAGC